MPAPATKPAELRRPNPNHQYTDDLSNRNNDIDHTDREIDDLKMLLAEARR